MISKNKYYRPSSTGRNPAEYGVSYTVRLLNFLYDLGLTPFGKPVQDTIFILGRIHNFSARHANPDLNNEQEK